MICAIYVPALAAKSYPKGISETQYVQMYRSWVNLKRVEQLRYWEYPKFHPKRIQYEYYNKQYQKVVLTVFKFPSKDLTKLVNMFYEDYIN
jgi:hypothetical protein